MRIWGDITKVSENDDGTLTVSGIASSEAVDSDGETVTATAMKEAIPDYMKFGALREMHQPIAAGTAIACEVQEDGRTYLEALVVDAESCRKVKAGVLKGFSIGGKVTKRNGKNKKVIEGIKLVEISLVDRPANPEAIIGLVKMEDTVDETTITSGPETQATGNAPAVDVEKAERLDIVKAWAGEEIMDAGQALACLDALFWLWQKELSDGDAAQAADLEVACGRLRAFIASEIMEDNSDNSQYQGDAVLEMGADTGDLEKKGAKYSQETKAALKAVKDAVANLVECMKPFEDMEAGEDAEEGEKAEAADAIQKAAALEDELVKAHQERDEAISKAVTLERELTTLKGQKPLKVVPVEKGKEDQTITKSEGAGAEPVTSDPLAAMKKVHATSGRLILTTRLG
jgi:hypothetical protein